MQCTATPVRCNCPVRSLAPVSSALELHPPHLVCFASRYRRQRRDVCCPMCNGAVEVDVIWRLPFQLPRLWRRAPVPAVEPDGAAPPADEEVVALAEQLVRQNNPYALQPQALISRSFAAPFRIGLCARSGSSKPLDCVEGSAAGTAAASVRALLNCSESCEQLKAALPRKSSLGSPIAEGVTYLSELLVLLKFLRRAC